MPERPQRSWWGRHWKWMVPVCMLTPILVCGGFVTLLSLTIFGLIKSSVPYTESLAAAQASPAVRQALGEPVEPGFFVTGNIEVSGGSGRADIAYTVSGPQASGTVYAVANKAAGEWTFTQLVLEVENTGQRIDLLSER